MDWDLVISRNRNLLLKIIASLYAMAGFAEGAVAEVMPRRIYGVLMLVLRPAESAVRRLIVIAARGLVLKPRASRPLPAGLAAFAGAGGLRTPAFCLFDPLRHFGPDDFDLSPEAGPGNGFSSFYGGETLPPASIPSMDELVDSQSLCHRLNALRFALGNLPGQARRDLALKREGPFRPVRMSVCRPGLPPGWRQRQLHEVDDILRDCHYFAREALERPDTS